MSLLIVQIGATLKPTQTIQQADGQVVVVIITGNLEYCLFISKGRGQSAKLGTHSAICSKLGTALQAYALNPCTKFPPNPTSRKVNT